MFVYVVMDVRCTLSVEHYGTLSSTRAYILIISKKKFIPLVLNVYPT